MGIKQLLQNPTMRKVLMLLALITVVFWPALSGMYTTWMEDSNNSHGVVVPLIVVYLIARKLKSQATGCRLQDNAGYKSPFEGGLRGMLSAGTQHPSAPAEPLPSRGEFRLTQGSLIGLIGMIASLLFYVFAVLMDIAVFKNVAFVLCVQSTALFVFGWPFVSQFAFPLFFLFFMVPVPVTLYGMIALPMQLFATKISVWVLGHTPLPVTADGNIIRIGEATLEVAEACSGLRSLMSFIMLSMLFAYLAKVSFVKRAVMVAASIPLAICGNIVRVVFTAFVAYFYGSKIASGFIHDVSGYVMFVAAFLVFMWLARVLEES